MFESKNSTDSSAEKSAVAENTLTENQKNIAAIAQITTHTMQKDLTEIAFDGEKETPKIPAAPLDTTEKTTTTTINPFLQPKEQEVSMTMEKTTSFKKVIISLVSVFIVIALLGGGYYFWVTRIKNSSIPDQPVETPPTDEPTQTPAATTTLPAFSEKQANYLSLDIQNSDAAGLKKTLESYAGKVSQMAPSGPIEFILTDTTNNPVPFSVFSQKIGIAFSPKILSQLHETFSFYIYLDNAQPRFGLALMGKDETLLKKALSTEENSLSQALSPLFPSSIAAGNDPTFKASLYNTATIRYNNFLSPDNYSIDYTLLQGHLIIGTSKMTTRAIIDSLSAPTSTGLK